MAEKLTTALILRRARAAWTTLHEKKGGWEIAGQTDAPLEIPAEADAFGPEMAARVKARCSGVRGLLTLGLPTSKALLRVVELPSVDADEIRGMAELQVDKFCPFPVDQMCIGFEVLGQSEGKSRVLVAAGPRDTLEKFGAVCAAAGLFPRVVDVEIMGWWWLLKNKGHIADRGRQIFLVIDDGGCELLISQDGQPLMIRALGSAETTPQSAAQEIVGEIQYTLTTLETEWGAGPVDAVNVWYGPETGDEMLRALASASSLHVRSSPLSSLPPLSEGIARRAVEGRGSIIDLSPPEWKVSLLSRAAQRRAIAIAASIFMVWLMVMGGIYGYRQHLQNYAVRLMFLNDSLKKKADDVTKLQKQVQSLERYSDRSYSALECLREVCTNMPAGPTLTSFNYEKYALLNLRGDCDSDGPILDFFAKLQSSKYFPKVEPGQITMVTRNQRQREEFKVKITLPPDPVKEEEKKAKEKPKQQGTGNP